MGKITRITGWVVVGLVDGVTAGVLIGLCFGWLTAGWTATGTEVAGNAAFFGAILGGMAGALSGAACEARCFPIRRLIPWTVAAALVGPGSILFWLTARYAHSVGARVGDQNALRQIGLALHNYHDKNGHLPDAALAQNGRAPEEALSWTVALLPFMDQPALYNSIDQAAAWDSPANRTAGADASNPFHNPRLSPARAAGGAVLTDFVGITGVGPDAATLPVGHPRAGVFGYGRRTTFKDIKDGSSSTMMVAQSASAGPWLAGGPATLRAVDPAQRPYVGVGRPFGARWRPDSYFALDVLLADCSVRGIHPGIKPEVFEALATIAGGEDVDPNDP
jgi:hypothetical protein